MTGSSEIERLVRRLDAESGGDAEDAQMELTRLGRETDVIAPLLRALPTLNSFGQLCAIEILQELGDARAGWRPTRPAGAGQYSIRLDRARRPAPRR